MLQTKVSTQKPYAFLFIKNEQYEKQIKKTFSFITPSKTITPVLHLTSSKRFLLYCPKNKEDFKK